MINLRLFKKYFSFKIVGRVYNVSMISYTNGSRKMFSFNIEDESDDIIVLCFGKTTKFRD